jgi:hypothetical protein
LGESDEDGSYGGFLRIWMQDVFLIFDNQRRGAFLENLAAKG